LAKLHKALHESRKDNLEILRHSEETFKLLKRADDRQGEAERDTQTAKIAQTFAEINQESAEEYRENMKERILELEAERDQAFEERDEALAQADEWRKLSERADPPASTTPIGTPNS
jgi:hypothetical protein